MDVENFRLRPYSQFPEITQNQRAILSQSRRIVLYLNLVLDCTEFQHPGYNTTITALHNQQISAQFHSRPHSFNAQLLICHYTIGKLKDAKEETAGRQFYEGIRCSDKNTRHEAALAKMDFKKPLLEELQKLSVEELNLLTEIPKFFKQPEKIRFVEGTFQNFWFQQHFWITFSSFCTYLTLILVWVFSNFAFKDIVNNTGFAVFGVLKWTVLQYIFHRFMFHFQIKSHDSMQGHLLHHSFPNHHKKVAVSIIDITYKLLLIALAYSFFLPPLGIGLIFLGFFTTIIFYDSIHYYCHFGPELDIPILKSLRINHLKHHYRDQSRHFGVTSTLWDFICRTDEPKHTPKQ